MTTYTVTAPLVLVRDKTRAFIYLYEHAVVPDYVDKDAIKDLLDSKMIAPVDEPAPPVDEPAPPAGSTRPAKGAAKAT